MYVPQEEDQPSATLAEYLGPQIATLDFVEGKGTYK